MTALRRLLLNRRLGAAWLIALALLARALVPAGFMVGGDRGSVTIEFCSGYGVQKMVMAIPGMEHRSGKAGDHGRSEPPCAFSGLATPSLSGADPLLLAAIVVFILHTVFRAPAVPVAPPAPVYLRPPLRGPPLQA